MKILAFSDIHSPFGHPFFLKWLQDVAEREQPDKIIINGDIFDNYAWSSFSLDPDKQSQRPEYMQALKGLQGYYKAFPDATLILGNHDRRPWRKAQTAGISSDFMVKFRDIYHCPPSWEVKDSVVVDGVLYTHGEQAGGQSGWQNLCLRYGQSVVIGHLHSVAGTRFHARTDGSNIFAAALGCGIDIDTYAFMYAKGSPNIPVLSCAIIEDGEQVKVVTMPKKLKNKKRRKIYE